MLAFDFQLSDIAIGVDTNKPFTFQIAIGLLNFADATNDGFIIGSGYQAPNLVEFDYFPDSGFGASVTTPMISSANNFASGGFTYPLELVPGALYHAVMIYTTDNQTLHMTLTSNNIPIGPLQDARITGSFGDFNVDTISVNSYNDAGQFPGYEGSVLAHGIVKNLFFANPLPVTRIANLSPGTVQFASTTNWIYTLEHTVNLLSWTDASPATPGIEGTLTLTDTNTPGDKAFLPCSRRPAMNSDAIQTICQPEKCPLCGRPNDCQLCTNAAYKGPCWCAQAKIPDALLARVPPDLRNQACICRTCVAIFHLEHANISPPSILPGDFYFDHGLMIFTAACHLRRGYCCGSGCRHCPYADAKLKSTPVPA